MWRSIFLLLVHSSRGICIQSEQQNLPTSSAISWTVCASCLFFHQEEPSPKTFGIIKGGKSFSCVLYIWIFFASSRFQRFLVFRWYFWLLQISFCSAVHFHNCVSVLVMLYAVCLVLVSLHFWREYGCYCCWYCHLLVCWYPVSVKCGQYFI